MTIEQKIAAASEYAHRLGEDSEAINDAANLWAESYDEYLALWAALEGKRHQA